METRSKKIIVIMSGVFFVGTQVFCMENVKAVDNPKKHIVRGCEIYGNRSFDKVYGYERENLEKDADNSTLILDEELEETLNYAGMSDKDICNLSSKDIEQIEAADRIDIKEEYYSENEKQLVKMSSDEISNYYKEKSENKESAEGIFDKVIGTQAINAESDIDAYKSSGGKFKHTVYEITKRLNGEKSIYFIYSATWLETPKYRGNDYFKLCIDNGHLQKDYNTQFKYVKYNNSYQISTGKCIRSERETINIKPSIDKHYFGTNSYLLISQKLPGKTGPGAYYSSVNDIKSEIGICDIYYIVSGYAYQSNKSNKYISLNAYYYHQENERSISFSGVSISVTGISMGFSAEEKKSYKSMGSGISTTVNVNNYSTK